MRELLDHSVATESTLDPTYLSAELPESPSEDVMEQSSLNSSDSILENTPVPDQYLDDNITHTLVPVSASTPQSKLTSMESPAHVKWHGFKVVGDNIDKTVKPRYMRGDAGGQSLHYFDSYAVRTGSTCTVAVTFHQTNQLNGPWRHGEGS